MNTTSWHWGDQTLLTTEAPIIWGLKEKANFLSHNWWGNYLCFITGNAYNASEPHLCKKWLTLNKNSSPRREIRIKFGKSKANGLRLLLWGAIVWLRHQKLIFSQFQKQEICCQDELLHRFLCIHVLSYLCACLWINSSFSDTPLVISTPLLASLHLTCLCLYLNFIEGHH